MRHHREAGADVERLVAEMDRVDEALARHLSDVVVTRNAEGRLLDGSEYARLQVQAWCVAAAKRGELDPEALAVTTAGIEDMDKEELSAMIRRMLEARLQGRTAPAA